MKFPDSNEMQSRFERYSMVRGVIEHEDNLINHRTSWVLIAQSFLFGACLASPDSLVTEVKILGTCIAIASLVSVLAAVFSISSVKKLFDPNPSDGFPPLTSGKWVHFFGLVAPIVVHVAFAIIWWVELEIPKSIL